MRLLVILLFIAALAPSVQATTEEPLLYLRIRADHPAFAVHVTILDLATNVTVFDGDIDLPEKGVREIELSVPEARYVAELSYRPASPTVLDMAFESGGYLGTGLDTRDCPGPAVLAFFVDATSVGTDDAGCLGLTRAAAELLGQARADKVGLLRSAFDIPLPGDADRGVMGGALFEWNGNVEFLDAWARPVVGSEVRYVNAAGGGTIVAGLLSTDAQAQVSDTVELFRFTGSDTRPIAWSNTVAGFGSADTPTSASVTIARELRYDDARGTLPCALRNGLQGTTLRPGDTVSPSDICSRWGGPAFRAGAPIDAEGHRLLPLYQLEETEERVVIGRVLLLDGIPYPLAMERYELPAGKALRWQGTSLDRYEPRGSPLDISDVTGPRPLSRLAPLDPLRGPATGDVGARMRFPLADASDAARADLTLRDLQGVLARPDAALIGATYEPARDPGSPVTMLRWTLLFSAEGVVPAIVKCERPDAGILVAPAARCAAPFPPSDGAGDFARVPSIGRASLPASAVSFGEALARWDATRAESPGAEMTYARYVAWEDGRAPQLRVGALIPAPLTPAATDASGSADHVSVELMTGRTLAVVALVQEGETLGAAPLGRVGPATLRAKDSPFADAASLPIVVGAGVGLALLALLGILLYSRLARTRVLDDETRAAIHAIVAAEPGIHASALRERVGKRGGVGEHHLDVLVREGYLTSVVTPGFHRYFITGIHTPVQMRAIAAMREGQNGRLMQIIRANPGIELRSLAAEAGISVPFVSRSVQRLAEAGLVEKVHVGKAIAVHAIPAAEA